MGNTSIQWTDKTFSPLRARVKPDAGEIATAKGYASLVQIATKMAGHVGPHCESVSEGCRNCYSDTNNGRCLPANGTGLPFDRRSRDLVDTFVDEKILTQPLKWRKPVKVFVENQSDLFGEWVTDEQIDRVFAVMALCPQHTFQVLTKRPERMLAYISRGMRGKESIQWPSVDLDNLDRQWPLSNVWLGVSVEDQKTADSRILWLLDTPAAKRFVSYEPALAAVDFTKLIVIREEGNRPEVSINALTGLVAGPDEYLESKLDWIIIGGESGPGARPFSVTWARQTIRECREAGVACFVKQFGAKPRDILANIRTWPEWRARCRQIEGEGEGAVIETRLKDRKGGEMAEWPEDLRVREFPRTA